MKLVTETGNGFYAWNGNVYKSDIVRACIRPKVKAIGKLVGKHIRETVSNGGAKQLAVNPEPWVKFLLEEPNPFMSAQKLQEKLATQLCLNNNAFALIVRDEMGIPIGIYPINALTAEAEYLRQGILYLKFLMPNGKYLKCPYSNIIHLRQDYNENDIFGDPIGPCLAPLMEIVSTTDQGIVKAVKNSSVIKWLLKFNTSMRKEDIEQKTAEFAASFMDINSGKGVAGVDAKADAQQIEPKDYVPNAIQSEKNLQRIYSLFNTNTKIIQSSYTEDEWNAYYESEIEPAVLDLKNEYTNKIFSRRQRGCGNSIVFEASNLQCASISTKLNLLQMVDRGAMTPNEWRAVLNLAPLPDGDKPIRRLDTALVKGVKENED